MLEIGARIKDLREKAGLSQQGLADAAGVPVPTLRDYEQGKREPGLARAKKLADAIGCKVDDFVSGEDKPKPKGKSKK